MRRYRYSVAIRQTVSAQRDVLALAYFGELSSSEIAERLGVPLGTVKGRMRLALDKMRELKSIAVDFQGFADVSPISATTAMRISSGMPMPNIGRSSKKVTPLTAAEKEALAALRKLPQHNGRAVAMGRR